MNDNRESDETMAVSIKVNVDNYVRATTSAQFAGMLRMSRGMNKFVHAPKPVALNKQSVERMNRDTIYSSAVVDISLGASLTIPESGDRYLSVIVMNEDYYTTAIYHDAGVYQLSVDEHDTPFVAIVARILADPTDPDDMKVANALQQGLLIDAAGEGVFTRPNYDAESFARTHGLLKQLGAGLADASYWNGKKEEVKETRHMIGAAFGWGGLPTYEVVYESVSAPRPLGTYQLNVKDVPVDGFWSISVYNKAGYFEENAFDSYSINNLTAAPNDDGSYTIHFGDCANNLRNCLQIMEGWNYVVRLYQPHQNVQQGLWHFPEPHAI
ncbi:MAG: DUF1214 domain-containing protein [Pseudomonadales bacterium]|nr:DUF1214 domain-containing protein [Pseudomonadales bacterium]